MTRTSPHSLGSERALLGQMMKDPDKVIPIMLGKLEPADFYRPDHSQLFMLLRDMFRNRQPIDSVTVTERVAATGEPDVFGGLSYVMAMPDQAPSTTNPEYYAGEVKRSSMARRGIEITQLLTDKLYSGFDVTALMAEAVADLTALKVEDTKALPTDFDAAFHAHMEYKEEVIDSGGLPRAPTGLYPLDGLLGGGFHMGTLNMLAARPSMGKTALAMNIALNSALSGVGCGVVSIEMSRRMIMDRFLSTLSGVPLAMVQDPTTWDQMVYDLLEEARQAMSGKPFRIANPKTATVEDVKALARAWKDRDDLKLLVVDYLGKIKLKGNRHEALGQACDDLKALAVELDIAILLIHSVNRGVEGVPTMAHLKDSGDIEYHADLIAFVDRPAYYGADVPRWEANVHVEKYRQGAPGKCALHWWGAYQRFCSPTEPHNPRPAGLMRRDK